MQIEVEAIDPADLEQIILDGVEPLVDQDVHAAVVEREESEVERLHEIAEQ